MSEEMRAGVWGGRVKRWELVEVGQDKSLKLVIWFKIDGQGFSKDVRFDGFLLKKDGTQNKKTFKTLKTCGFTGTDITDLIEDTVSALDTETVFDLDCQKNEDGYWFVDWVNGGSLRDGAVTNKAILKGHNLAKINSFFGPAKPKAKQIKNYAPQSAPPEINTSEEIDDFLN